MAYRAVAGENVAQFLRQIGPPNHTIEDVRAPAPLLATTYPAVQKRCATVSAQLPVQNHHQPLATEQPSPLGPHARMAPASASFQVSAAYVFYVLSYTSNHLLSCEWLTLLSI